MKDCDAIDLLAFIDGREPSPEDKEHLQTCKECRMELETLRSVTGVLSCYFSNAMEACPREAEVLDWALGEQRAMPADLEAHVAACPSCASALLMALTGTAQADEPPARAVALPPSLREAVTQYRRRRLVERTSGVLEQMHRDGQWASDLAEKAASDGNLGLAAAPEDLTRAGEDEPGDGAAPDSDPDGRDDTPKGGDQE